MHGLTGMAGSMLTLTLLLLACARAARAAAPATASMSASGGKCVAGGTHAHGSFDDAMQTTGWGQLRVTTSAAASHADQAFAAGCVEAKLTVQQTHDYWLNYMREEYHADVPPPRVVAFMLHQQEWLRSQMMDSANAGDEYWEAMKLVMAQWDGFAAGIQQFATPEQLAILSPSSLYLLCSVGDLETINGLVSRAPLPVPSLAYEDTLQCSSLISLQVGASGDVIDIFASQATWRSYYVR